VNILCLPLIVLLLATKPDEPRPRPSLLSVEALSRGPAVAAVRLSPDGERIAAIETVEGRAAISLAAVTGERKSVRYRDGERSIGNVAWSGSGQWLYFFQDKGGDEGYHLFALDPDSELPPRDLTPFKGATAVWIRSHPTHDQVLVALNSRDPEYPDAYRVHLADGRLEEIVRNPGRFIEYFAGDDVGIAAATAIEKDGALTVHRPAEDAWTEIYRAPPGERLQVLGAAGRPGFLVIRSNRGTDQETLRWLDLEHGATEPVGTHSCARFDAEDIVVEAGTLLGGSCIEEAPTLWSSAEAFSRAIADVRKLVGPDAGLWFESASRDHATMAFFTNRGDDPGRYLMWRSGEVSVLADARPWLDKSQLVPTRAQWFTARDGLPLLGYVTRPGGSVSAGPAVVAIHGGPWSRDMGGFETETQLLANRGYTVVQVNFRGSTGLGKRTFDAGVGQFGRKMSDDVDDVINALAEQGVVDRDKVCLLGGSYGGYAALMGIARNAMPYRCAVSFAGPTDLATLIAAFPTSWRPFLPRSWYRFVGDPAVPEELADMKSHSPVNLADRMNAPLLIFQGLNDPRVRKDQSDAIVCSLRKRGVEVIYLVASNEGHSFANEETRLAVNLSVERFLADHLGGRVQEAVHPETETALRALVAAGQTGLDCSE
jgi:dipeptidyl aminopeptidase/acylaminoacyl peptidase